MKFATTVKTLGILGVTVLGLSAGASQANPYGPPGVYNPYPPVPQFHAYGDFRKRLGDFDQRLDNQLHRILDGMESGKLTMREAIGLLREHQAINALERQYLADGRMGPGELLDLDRRLDQASRHILFEKQDASRQGYYAPYGDWRR